MKGREQKQDWAEGSLCCRVTKVSANQQVSMEGEVPSGLSSIKSKWLDLYTPTLLSHQLQPAPGRA